MVLNEKIDRKCFEKKNWKIQKIAQENRGKKKNIAQVRWNIWNKMNGKYSVGQGIREGAQRNICVEYSSIWRRSVVMVHCEIVGLK